MPEAPRREGVVLPRILGLDPGTAAGAALASFESVLAPALRTRAFVEWTPARADAVARFLGILARRLGKELTEIRALFPEPLLDTLVALAGLTR